MVKKDTWAKTTFYAICVTGAIGLSYIYNYQEHKTLVTANVQAENTADMMARQNSRTIDTCVDEDSTNVIKYFDAKKLIQYNNK
jgi:hypothetical protein